MKITQKLEKLFESVSKVRFENENGPAYAYMQLMSYNRQIIKLASQVPHTDRLTDGIDAVNWMLNEYLGAKFTPRHQSVMEEKLLDLHIIFNELRFLAQRFEPLRVDRYKSVHAQAA